LNERIALMRIMRRHKDFLFTNAVFSGIAALDVGYNGINKVAGLLRGGHSLHNVVGSWGSLECLAAVGFVLLGKSTFGAAKGANKSKEFFRKEMAEFREETTDKI
jgi:hypothetical protein